MALQPASLDGSKGLVGVIVGGIFGLLATVAVALRIVSRRMTKARLGADDYMMVVALVGTSRLVEEGATDYVLCLDLLLWMHRL